jgi:hypothetical protein
MALFRVEGNHVAFVVDVNSDGFVVVFYHQFCILGKFQSLIVMVIKKNYWQYCLLSKITMCCDWLQVENECREL